MLTAAAAAVTIIALWYVSTGAILYLDGLSRRTVPWTLTAGLAVGAASLLGLAATAGQESVGAAFLASACAIGVWGFNELAFLTGVVTGPNRRPAAPGLGGVRRFRAAAGSIIHHEILLALSGVVVALLTLPGPNLTGLWTFAVLWVMRLSAKLNLFVGVPNPGESLLPDHLAYLGGHFRRQRVGSFFVVTTSAATVALAVLVTGAALSEPAPHQLATVSLVATLLALAILEHWFLALPLPPAQLWGWSLKRHPSPPPRPQERTAADPALPPLSVKV
jgi:putative photosynthetic complex assembly protein 2